MRLLFSATLLAAIWTSPAYAQEFGRLFTTAGEREGLDRMRRGGPPPRSAAAGPAEASAGAPLAAPRPVLEGEQLIVVNGIVTRSGSGRATTWIDAVPRDANTRLAGGIALARGRSNASIALTLPAGRTVQVKAGQSVDAVSGKVREVTVPAP
jgi:hypothetical protein